MTRGYRVWDKQNEEYMNGYEVLLKNDGSVISRYALMTFDTDMPVNAIIEWDTGLKDKNGKKIYVGDIIESWYLNGDGNGGYYDAGNFEVVFKNGAVGVMRKESFYTFDEIERDELEDLVVIGTIHENPELLGGKK